MLYVNKSNTIQTTVMPRMNDLFWNKTRTKLFGTNKNDTFLEIGMKQEQIICLLVGTKQKINKNVLQRSSVGIKSGRMGCKDLQ